MRYILIFLPLSLFGQFLSNTPDVIYKAQQKQVMTVSFMPTVEGQLLNLKSTDSVYAVSVPLSGEHVRLIPLDSGEVIIASGAGIQYERRINGQLVNFASVNDNTPWQIRTAIQSLDGLDPLALTLDQSRRIIALLLYERGVLTENRRISGKALLKSFKH